MMITLPYHFLPPFWILRCPFRTR